MAYSDIQINTELLAVLAAIQNPKSKIQNQTGATSDIQPKTGPVPVLAAIQNPKSKLQNQTGVLAAIQNPKSKIQNRSILTRAPRHIDLPSSDIVRCACFWRNIDQPIC